MNMNRSGTERVSTDFFFFLQFNKNVLADEGLLCHSFFFFFLNTNHRS
jgi:hypothetical protein